MREIIFRGKRVDNGEWVYGYYCESVGRNKSYIATDVDGDVWEVDLETVGQFTGLYDCKRIKEYPEGQPIYEGDIVRCRAGEEYQGVSEYDACFVVEYGWTQSMWEMMQVSGSCGSIEVINNIHDSPELLP